MTASGRSPGVVIAGLAAAAVLVTIAIVSSSDRAARNRSATRPAPPPGELELATPLPEPAPTDPRPAPGRSGSSSYVVPWRPTPTPWPTVEPYDETEPIVKPRRTRAPQPCVEYSWGASDSSAVAGQMILEVRVRNRCGRKLEPHEVAFEARAYHDGDLIWSGRGSLLEAIYPDSVRTVMIAFPGATSYFDRIDVVPINPPPR